jgi:beta-lactamase superfamily II metal-dependent hydrolase
MKIRIFHSDKGDCLLISGANGGRILSDGGMRESFVAHVAKHLKDVDPIDLVCVSHVDDDHIGGILEMLDNAMAWKIFQHHRDDGDTDFNEPKVPPMPRIKRMWHNAFHDQIGANAGEVADLLAAMVPVLAGVDDVDLQDAAIENEAIVFSNQQAIQVSQRLRPEQLNIPLNEDGKLIMVRNDNRVFRFGSLSARIVVPFAQDLENLRDAWNKWLRGNKDTVKKLRDKAKRDAAELEDDVQTLIMPALAAVELGDRSKVTPPNLASIMIHVEDGGKTLLLTGDGHADDALKGLDHLGNVLAANGTVHLDVLKVQHHGSEHNMTKEFARRVTADNYVFCGNGFSGNPEHVVIQALFDARIGGAGPNRQFKFWFNSSSASETKQDRKKHMREVEQQVAGLAQQSNRLKSFFLGQDDFVDFGV